MSLCLVYSHAQFIIFQTPAQTARTQLLSTVAACEGARPGMLSHLPRDIPPHEYFPRYGPLFELVSEEKRDLIFASYSKGSSDKEVGGSREGQNMPDSDLQILKEANRAIELATLYLERQKEKKTPQTSTNSFSYNDALENDDEAASSWLSGTQNKKKSARNGGGGRRRKKKRK